MSSEAPSPSAATTEPDWIEDALRETRLLAYVRTLREILRGPRAFAAAWAEGRTSAVNPFLFLLTSVAVLTAQSRLISLVFSQLYPAIRGLQKTWWADAAKSFAPYLYYVAVAVLAHVVMRGLGSTRKLRSTVGIALYVGGSFTTLFLLVYRTVGMAFVVARGSHEVSAEGARLLVWVGVTLGLEALAFFVPLALALVGLHRVATWKTALSLAAIFLMLAGLFGRFQVHFDNIPQPALWLTHGSDGWDVSFSD